MSKELDDWRHDQINSRPTVRRKLNAYEAAVAERAYKKVLFWEKTQDWVATTVLALLGIILLAAGAFIGIATFAPQWVVK